MLTRPWSRDPNSLLDFFCRDEAAEFEVNPMRLPYICNDWQIGSVAGIYGGTI